MMNPKKLILACFSPSGGTKKVAQAIAGGFDLPVEEVDLTVEIPALATEEGDLLVALVPVYAGRVPKIALDRLSRIRGEGGKAVAVAVYGNREFDDALLETKEALEGNGYEVIAAAAFIAEHSIVRSVAAGRPDGEDVKLAHDFAKEILRKWESPTSVAVPGNVPYAQHPPTSAHPSANETCLQCGACAKGCPTGAISAEDLKTCKGDLCINCLRCVQACPVQCRSLPAPFLSWISQMLQEKASGYKKPEFFL